ncbi:MAG: hypothetical protein ABIN67_24980 [Ferruginibacter sp.]
MLKYCTVEEYHAATSFLKILEEIKTEYKEFENDWFKIVMKKLVDSRPNFYNSDERDELFMGIYTISFDTVQQDIQLIIDFMDSRKEEDLYDVVEALNILAYFEQYKIILQQLKKILPNFKRVKLTEHFFRFCELLENIAEFEMHVPTGNADKNYLKNIIDEIEKAKS